MNFFERLAARMGWIRTRGWNGFAAAQIGRLQAKLVSETDYINRVLRYQLRALRARSRQLAMNDPMGRRFIQMVKVNVAGADPFTLQCKARMGNGELDLRGNRIIEDAWTAWGKPGVCELTGKLSLRDVLRLVIGTVAQDGEVLLRKVRMGPFGYQLQMLDTDRLDEQKNEDLGGGRAIHMGVELDQYSRPVAYHLLKRKPSDLSLMGGYSREYERVPADEIIHLYVVDYPEQIRGIPWMFAAILKLYHLGEFELAAVIAARMGASKVGVIQSPDGEPPQNVATGTDSAGNMLTDMEPGQYWTLPPGYQLQGWDPGYPDAAIEPFIKSALRSVASGLGVSYHTLANDLESVNYSSARVGLLDERETWKTLQGWLCEHFLEPVYGDWLRWGALNGAIGVPLDRIERYRLGARFQPRRWASVDPVKEANADEIRLRNRLTSRTRIAAEQGVDIADVFEESAQEQALAEQYGIDLTPTAPQPQRPAADAPPKDDADAPDQEQDNDAAQT